MCYKKLTPHTFGLLLTAFVLHTVFSAYVLYADSLRFTDITAELGVEFRHVNGESGQKYFIEPIGSGAVLFDFDNDGDLDLYLINGSDLPGRTSPVAPTNRLYRNDGDTFTDVTIQAAVGDTGYGLGGCVGDYNNDGFTDLYVTNYGPNVLYRNNGDGTFTDVTESTGIAGNQLSSGCAFVDIDADGYLDLYVVNYVQFDPETNPECTRQGIRTYCTPEALHGAADILYHNNRDGTFRDITAAAGISGANGKGLGVVCGDVDNDGDTDIFVANDTTPNFLYLNDSNAGIKMTEDALFAGVALSEEGRAYSGMGANLGDFDNDSYLDIVITNFQDQTNSLYHNGQSGFFNEVSFAKGIGEKSLRYLAWGTDFVDFNNDGWLDLFVANGHLDDNIAEIDPIGTYAQPNQLFLNNGGISFEESADVAIAVQKVSRGTAFGDIDNDGDMDIVVSNLKDTPTILRNDSGNASQWLLVKLIGTHCNRDAIGARVTVVSDGSTQIREVKSGSGYLSQNDLRLHFGLGDATRVDTLTVQWLCGKVQTIQDIETNQVLVISEE